LEKKKWPSAIRKNAGKKTDLASEKRRGKKGEGSFPPVAVPYTIPRRDDGWEGKVMHQSPSGGRKGEKVFVI